MRIQHNIMAMNAYRNYNTNTSALSKNLEKLSSGYKINRAGDDAAGLAISEKMRAQITGLNAAQKNVKDGISLVKTAEGAMQEIQDMLNRMDYLATQSANGTYDDPVDRKNLQKEVDALKTEINRIADSANFNGINLLDGSMADGVIRNASKEFNLPPVGELLATNTILHKDAGTETTGTSFSVDLHDTKFANQAGDKLTLTVGEGEGAATLELTGAANNTDGTGAMDGAAIAAALQGAYSTVEINGQTFDVTLGGDGDDRLVFTQQKVPEAEDQVVKGNMKVSVTGALGGTKFIEGTSETGKTATVNNGLGDSLELTVDWNGGAAIDMTSLAGKTFTVGDFTVTLTDQTVNAGDDTQVQVTDSSDPANILAAVETALQNQATAAATTEAGKTPAAGDTYTKYSNIAVNVNATTGAVEITADTTVYAHDTANPGNWDGGTAGAAATGTTTATANDKVNQDIDWTSNTAIDMNSLAGKKLSVVVGGKTISVELVASDATAPDANDNTKLQLAATNDPATLLSDIQAKMQAQFDAITTAGEAGTKSYTKVENLTLDVDGDGNITATADTQKFSARTDSSVVGGDHNFQTTDIKTVGLNGQNRLAGTFFDFTKDMIEEGATMKIGNETYTFTNDLAKSKVTSDGTTYVYIGDLNSNDDDYVDDVGERLSDAAGNNKTWTVGYHNGKLSFEEIEGQSEYVDEVTGLSSLTDMETIASTFGWSGGSVTGKPLTLQIGDTSESFNQMTLSIGDMHTDAMGTTGGKSIADIDISKQKGAQEAVQVIKDAINYVSSVRGDLGATQNRLEHTQNNLSVMAENIQDAESTIRDTDIAEEMMSYTKNNILIQSAQAMLAQANAVPQGVLQLLG